MSEAPHGSVVAGDAEALPLGDDSVDVVHARWAYFFGAGCERGLAEASRVLRPGGTVLLVDNDASRSTFGRWFRRAYPAYDAVAVQRFWDRQGFTTERLTIEWTFDQRRDLEAVVRIELPPAAADEVLAETTGSRSTMRWHCGGGVPEHAAAWSTPATSSAGRSSVVRVPVPEEST